MAELSSSGFTMVSNDVTDMVPLMGASAYTLYTVLMRDTVGFHQMEVSRSIRTLMNRTGFSVNRIQRAIKKLESLGFIRVVRSGFNTLRFVIREMVNSGERGFQYTTQFLTQLGFKPKEPKPKPVSKTDTSRIQNEYTAVSKTDAYKERNKNLNKSQFNSHQKGKPIQGQVTVDVENIMRAVKRFGRHQYREAVASLGNDTARRVVKDYGWANLCNSNANFSGGVVKQLTSIYQELQRAGV